MQKLRVAYAAHQLRMVRDVLHDMLRFLDALSLRAASSLARIRDDPTSGTCDDAELDLLLHLNVDTATRLLHYNLQGYRSRQ
jgi:hypothetical protein